MTISKDLQLLLAAPDHKSFHDELMRDYIEDARTRNPDVTSEKMLEQLARPKYDFTRKAINKELESLKIMNRRKDGKD